MAVIPWGKAKTVPRRRDPEGFMKLYVDESIGAKKLRIHLSTLGVHRSPHEPHRHEWEEVFFILEGEAKFTVDGRELKAGPMSAVFIPSGSLHGIENAGDRTLKYLVITTK